MDKIFVDEAVSELHTIQDMLRWSVSRFAAADLWYGHGTDNPWDEAVQLVLPTLYLPLDIPEDMRTARLTSSERHRIVERVIRRINERIPVAYMTNKAWFCGHEFYVDERVLVPRSPIAELINERFAGILPHEPGLFWICVLAVVVSALPVLMLSLLLKLTWWISPLMRWRSLSKILMRTACNTMSRQSVLTCSASYRKHLMI